MVQIVIASLRTGTVTFMILYLKRRCEKISPSMKRNQNNCDLEVFLWKGQRINILGPIPNFLPYRSWSCTIDRKGKSRHFALI